MHCASAKGDRLEFQLAGSFHLAARGGISLLMELWLNCHARPGSAPCRPGQERPLVVAYKKFTMTNLHKLEEIFAFNSSTDYFVLKVNILLPRRHRFCVMLIEGKKMNEKCRIYNWPGLLSNMLGKWFPEPPPGPGQCTFMIELWHSLG